MGKNVSKTKNKKTPYPLLFLCNWIKYSKTKQSLTWMGIAQRSKMQNWSDLRLKPCRIKQKVDPIAHCQDMRNFCNRKFEWFHFLSDRDVDFPAQVLESHPSASANISLPSFHEGRENFLPRACVFPEMLVPCPHSEERWDSLPALRTQREVSSGWSMWKVWAAVDGELILKANGRQDDTALPCAWHHVPVWRASHSLQVLAWFHWCFFVTGILSIPTQPPEPWLRCRTISFKVVP